MDQRRLTVLILCLCGFIGLNLFVLDMPVFRTLRGGRAPHADAGRGGERDAVEATRGIISNARKIFIEDAPGTGRAGSEPGGDGSEAAREQGVPEDGKGGAAAVSATATGGSKADGAKGGVMAPKPAREFPPAPRRTDGKYATLSPHPESYELVSASVVESAASNYAGARIRFRAHVEAVYKSFDAVACADSNWYSQERFLKIITSSEDFTALMIPRESPLLMAKITQLEFGERVQVFGTMLLSRDRANPIVLVDDLVADQ